MMSPITVRADVDGASDVSEPTAPGVPVGKQEQKQVEVLPNDEETKTLKAIRRTRSGAAKLDAALQALNEQHERNKGVNRKSPSAEADSMGSKREGRRNNARNTNSGRTSEESVRSGGRKSGDGGSRKSQESINRRSNESQRSSTTETVQQDDAADQLSQITDILLARLITTLSDSTLGNPALLLQTLLGFSPDDYNDLLAALSESRLSYVDIISAYLHNIRVMSEDSGSTSAALSGTLTRSLIEQYNSLLAQAVKSPQSIARANLLGDTDGRSHLADLLQKANASDGKPERRSFESLLPKGPSGLGFGRRHSAETSKQRQQQQQQSLMPTDTTTKAMAQSTTTDTSMLDFTKMFANVPKLPGPDMNAIGSMGMVHQGGNTMGGISHDQLAAFLQSAGMLGGNGGAPYTTQQSTVPSLPFHPNPAGNGNMNGMLAMSMNNPFVHQMQPFAVPMQQQQQQMTGSDANRSGPGWQNGTTTIGCQQPMGMYRGWCGSGLETVHENLNSHMQQHHHHHHHQDPSFFPQAINMQQQHGQQ